jgi:hypothetical protein
MAEVSPQVRQSFEFAQQLRRPWEGRWQRLVELAMPYRSHFTEGGEFGSSKPRPSIYDETGPVSVEECAARFQDGIMPQGVQWGLFYPGPNAPPEFAGQIAGWQEQLFDHIAQSNLGSEASDCYKDMAGLGNWCMRVVGGNWRMPLRFQSFALPDVWATPGINGGIADLHVRHRVPRYALAAQWPGIDLSSLTLPGGGMQVSVIESWVQDLTAPVERWRWEAHLGNQRLAHGEAAGVGSCDYIFGRWGKASGELYGTGQGMHVLPAMEVVNEAMRLVLAHGDLALSGMWQAEDDGVLNPWAVRLVPGTIIPKAPGSQGLTPLQFATSKMDIGQLVLAEQRFAIRKGLFSETLGAREGTPPSATEVEARMVELARAVGPSILRVWTEFCVPLLERARYLLEQRGLLDMPALDGQRMRIKPMSALVRAAALAELGRLDRLLGGIAQHYGPQAVPALVPPDRYADFARRRLDIPANVLLSEADRRRQAARTGAMVGDAVKDPQAGLGTLLASLGVEGNGGG